MSDKRLIIRIEVTVETPNDVNPSIAINQALRELSGMGSVLPFKEAQTSKTTSPEVTCIATWEYEERG
jgi:hypothetical protein